MAEEDKEKQALAKQITTLNEELITLERQLPPFSAKRDDINDLVDEYGKALNSSFGSAALYDYNGRELFLSSLEQLIILNQDGYSYGSCVSGKDRKAIELIHTDAMIIYKKIYEHWPSLTHATSSAERTRFVALVAKLYLSAHQHELAGQNAPGSEGIKTPLVYLPKDICNEIIRLLGIAEALKQDDRLATNNEVKNIFSAGSLDKYLLPERELGVSLTLGEEWCTQLYDSLVALLNQKHLFKPIKSSFFSQELPTGIAEIKRLMKDPSAGDTNTERLTRIMNIVNTRPSEEASRTDATKMVYDGIRGLCDPSLKTDAFIKYATGLKTAWDALYNRSKVDLAKIKRREDSSSDEEAPSPVTSERYTM